MLLLWATSTAWAQAPVFQQGPNFGVFSIGQVEIQLAATGGDGTNYAWEVLSGSLPPGVSLRSDRATWFQPNSKAGLIGIATTPGTYTFRLRVTSGALSSVQDATIRITTLRFKEHWQLPTAYANVQYSAYTLSANGNTGPVTWTAISGLPPGMTLSSVGVLSGTPTISGYFNIWASLTDGTSTVFRNLNISVQDIRITSPALLPSATQGMPYTTVIAATGGAPPYDFSSCTGTACSSASAGLPGGLLLDPSTGEISGTINTGPGRFSFYLTVTDSNHVSQSKWMTIYVIGVPPTLPYIFPYTGMADCSVGMPCTQAVGVTSGGTPPFTWNVTGLPPGMDFRSGSGVTQDWISAPDVEFWGTPAATGTFAVTATVTDALGASTSNTYPVHVSSMWQTDYMGSGTIGVPYSQQLRFIGGPSRPLVPGTAVTPSGLYAVQQTAGRLPVGITFNPANFTTSGTSLETGSFNASYRLTDLNGETFDTTSYLFFAGAATSTIQINTFDDFGISTVGSFFSRQLSACCVPSYAWSFTGGTLPPGLTLTVDGLLSGTLTTAETYNFLIQVADATNPNNYAVRRFTLVVATGAAPLISVTTFTLPFGNVGTPYNLTLTATGGTGTLTWTLSPNTYPPPGLTVGQNGAISGTPTSTGQYFFTVRVTDSVGNFNLRGFNLSIYPPGETPPLNLPIATNFGTRLPGVFTLSLAATGGRPPYHYSLTPGAPAIPGMRVQDGPPLPIGFASGAAGYLGVLETPGTFASSIRVSDSTGQTFDRAFTVTVSSIAIVSQSPPRATLGQFYSFSLVPYGGSGNYSWSLSSANLPQGVTLDSTGRILGTPTAPGTYFVNVVLTDLTTSASVIQSFTLIVDPFAIITGGVLPQATVGTPYNLLLDAPGCGSGCTWTSVGVLPSGLSLSSGGAISGTPTFSSNSSVSLRASGSNGTAQKLFSLWIGTNPPQPLSIGTSAQLGYSTVGGIVTTPLLAAAGTPPFTWSFETGTLPPGVSLEAPGDAFGSNLAPGWAYLTGRPMQTGTYNFTLRVTDGVGAIATRSFTWVITPVVFQYFNLPLAGSTLVYNTPYLQPLLVIGGTGNYAWTNNGPMPPGLTLNPSTGIVSGTPANTGAVSVPIQVTDDAGHTTVANIIFIVSSPTGTTLNFATNANLGFLQIGSTFNFNVTPSGGTPPYTVTALTPLPTGFALQSGTTFSVVGLPMASGTISFTLQAQDSAGNIGVRTFTGTVTPFALITSTSLPDGSAGVPYSQSILVFDSAGTVSWALAPGSQMPPGTSVSAGGLISGTPTLAGTYTFILVAADSSTLVARSFSFSLRISGISIGDSAVLPSATLGVPYSYTFTSAGGGSTKVWTATGLPGGLTMSATGTISGTPTTTGTFGVVVSVTDGVLPFSRRFGLISRNLIPGPIDFALASTTLPDVTIGQTVLSTLNATGGTPPYTWSLAFGSTLPGGLQLLAGATLPYGFTPGTTLLAGLPTTQGLYTFDLIATDSLGAQVRRTFSLNVSAIGLISTSSSGAVIDTAFSEQFTGVGGTAPYSFTMSPIGPTQEMLPPGLSMSTGGLISGTPTSTGNYFFSLRVQDAAGHTLTRTFSLLVTNALLLFVSNNNPIDTWVGRRQSLTLSATSLNGVSLSFAWSHVSGTLPDGVGLLPINPTGAMLSGAPTTAGVYTFTLRATDIANSANFADRRFTLRVAPMQVVAPAIGLGFASLPGGRVGAAYLASLKMAGGTPPYTFSTPTFSPLPPGLSMSPDGVLSGTPQISGNFVVAPIITDAAGRTLTSPGMLLLVTPAGVAPPILSVAAALPVASSGAPYQAALNLLIRGGTAPFNWTLGGSSALPTGITLLAGGNGVSDYLGGVPSIQGSYSFTLIASDSAGQTLSLPFTVRVTGLALSPASVPAGRVGTPYSVSFVPSGGAAPYVVQRGFSDMPPGLSLSASGVLSGTPTDPGNFLVVLTVTDASGLSMTRMYRVTIDNAAGQAPALDLSPKPIQVYYELGSLAPSPIPVSVTTTSGTLPFGLSLSGVPGGTLSSNSGATNATVNLNLNVSSLAAGTYVGILAAASPLSANQIDATPVTLTVSPAPPCSYGVSPSAGTSPAGGGPGSFNLATAPSCGWTATVSDPSWITLTSSAGGTGPGAIGYSVAPNGGPTQRSGTITVGGRVYAITQFGSSCSFAISPANLSASSAGGPAYIKITASSFACPWTASGLSAFPTAGAGSGGVFVNIPANASPGTRLLTATIAGQTLNVTQGGIDCPVALGPQDASSPFGGGPGSVAVTTPAVCAYGTAPGPSWITITSGGSGVGPGTLVYSVEPNSTTVSRTGTLTIGGQAFQITQAALPCSVTVDTSNLGSPYGPAGGVGTIGITANGPNCSWTASSGASWASVTPTSGAGNGVVGVTIGSNASATSPRSAALTIAGQTINISEDGTLCSFTLQSASGSVPAAGASGSVGVIAPAVCGWTATPNNPDWLTIASSGSAGSSDVHFAAQPNAASTPRFGTLTIAGLAYSVTQAGAPCSYSLSATNISVSSDGVTGGSFTFSTSAAGCSPLALSYSNWLTVNTAFSGTSGSVTYGVEANPTTANRSGVIQVGAQTFTVNQLGGACGYSLHSYGALFNRFGGSSDLFGSPSALACTPVFGTDQPNFVLLGPLSGPLSNIFTLPYAVTPFSSLTNSLRIGRITFGGRIFTIKQTSY